MADQRNDKANVEFVSFTTTSPPPPDRLVVRDEVGQQWAISVRSDGQLQTAKYPDGEPRTITVVDDDSISPVGRLIRDGDKP